MMTLHLARRAVTALAAAAALTAGIATSAQAAPRDLDRTFGDEGVALTRIGAGDSAAWSMARQPDGRVLVVGSGDVPRHPDGRDNTALALTRYMPDGSLDRSFGGGDGVVLQQYGYEGSLGEAVIVQPDGKIVVAGITGYPVIAGPLFVARFLPNGAPDTTFGDRGAKLIEICCDASGAEGLALQPDGKIVMAGYVHNTFTVQTIVARFLPNGQLDPSYGSGGVSRPRLGDATETWSLTRGLVLEGERAVLVGRVATGGDQPVYGQLLTRLDEHGALDRSFGTDGLAVDDSLEAFAPTAVARSADGSLTLAGATYPDGNGLRRADYVLARYSADGVLDESFNAGGGSPGHVIGTVGDEDYAVASDLAIDPRTGGITMTGWAGDEGETKLMVARYTSYGTRDDRDFRSASGSFGPRLLDAGNEGTTRGNAVILDVHGGILVSGFADENGLRNVLLARFGDPIPRPNHAPIARIAGHRSVPRFTWVKFDGGRSHDSDGHIVEYAWRAGNGRYHKSGPTFWHRVRGPGFVTITLRVTDDDGAVSYAKRRVTVR
jgi:uncharacterized delta-60 repeat protein